MTSQTLLIWQLISIGGMVLVFLLFIVLKEAYHQNYHHLFPLLHPRVYRDLQTRMRWRLQRMPDLHKRMRWQVKPSRIRK